MGWRGGGEVKQQHFALWQSDWESLFNLTGPLWAPAFTHSLKRLFMTRRLVSLSFTFITAPNPQPDNTQTHRLVSYLCYLILTPGACADLLRFFHPKFWNFSTSERICGLKRDFSPQVFQSFFQRIQRFGWRPTPEELPWTSIKLCQFKQLWLSALRLFGNFWTVWKVFLRDLHVQSIE